MTILIVADDVMVRLREEFPEIERGRTVRDARLGGIEIHANEHMEPGTSFTFQPPDPLTPMRFQPWPVRTFDSTPLYREQWRMIFPKAPRFLYVPTSDDRPSLRWKIRERKRLAKKANRARIKANNALRARRKR